MALEGEVIFGSGEVQRKHIHINKTKNLISSALKTNSFSSELLHSRVWRVDVMNRHSALNASKCKTCGLVLLVLEYGDTTVLRDKRGMSFMWH